MGIEETPILAAVVPPPRAHLTRFHGVFAPKEIRVRVEWHLLKRGIQIFVIPA
ncbi:MAG: hypothetical protein ABL859_05855 [Methylotenera sp.]